MGLASLFQCRVGFPVVGFQGVRVSTFTAPVTSLRVNLGVFVTYGSLGDVRVVGARLCREGLSSVLHGPPGFVRKPAQSHSPYGMLFVVPSYG
nr:hypothetical protein CFP56_51117 [Quercus suber]